MAKVVNLSLGVGSQRIDWANLKNIQAPAQSGRHYPIGHHDLVETVQRHVESRGMKIANQDHAVANEGKRYFGLMQVERRDDVNDDYGTVIGIRNSHDKRFSAGRAIGAQVFVCDNLSFSGEVNIARKHTRYILRDLDNLVERALGRLGDLRNTMDYRIDAYKNTSLSDVHGNDLLIKAFEARVIGATKLPAVLKEWRKPQHAEFQPRTAWSMFNAFTEVMKGSNVFNMPSRTQALHGVFDAKCGVGLSKTPEVAAGVN